MPMHNLQRAETADFDDFNWRIFGTLRVVHCLEEFDYYIIILLIIQTNL